MNLRLPSHGLERPTYSLHVTNRRWGRRWAPYLWPARPSRANSRRWHLIGQPVRTSSSRIDPLLEYRPTTEAAAPLTRSPRESCRRECCPPPETKTTAYSVA